MRKVINWLIDKWLAGFITALFFFLLKAYLDLPPENKVSFFKFKWFSSLMSLEIKLWQVLIVITFIIIMITIKRFKKGTNQSPSKIPDPPSYRIDKFGINDSKWTWDYDYDPSTGKFNVKNVVPLCPICESPMEHNDIARMATCSKCRLEGKRSSFGIQQYSYDVAQEIIRRYNSGEWKKPPKTAL